MSNLIPIIIIIQVVTALIIIALVLLQHGKGADMGAAFGSGSSGSLFGASGSSNFLSKFTALAALIFFISTLALSFIVSRPISLESDGGVMGQIPRNDAEQNIITSSDLEKNPSKDFGKASDIPK